MLSVTSLALTYIGEVVTIMTRVMMSVYEIRLKKRKKNNLT